jgi:hypothetical protein
MKVTEYYFNPDDKASRLRRNVVSKQTTCSYHAEDQNVNLYSREILCCRVALFIRRVCVTTMPISVCICVYVRSVWLTERRRERRQLQGKYECLPE